MRFRALQVEDTLYRVHRYLFEMHATKRAFQNQCPYFLPGVKRVDFDRLLALLYPRLVPDMLKM